MTTPRIIGTGYHVVDLERSLDFYTRILGMVESRRFEFPGVREVLLKCQDHDDAPAVVLVHRDDAPGPFELGDAYGRLIVAVDDTRAVVREVVGEGLEVEMEPSTFDETGATIAVVKDPDGFRVELVQSS